MKVKCYMDCEIIVDDTSDIFPYCSPEHKKEWGDKHYGTQNSGKKKSIKEIQEGLLKMAREARKKEKGGLFEI